jgi:hypothetical protein
MRQDTGRIQFVQLLLDDTIQSSTACFTPDMARFLAQHYTATLTQGDMLILEYLRQNELKTGDSVLGYVYAWSTEPKVAAANARALLMGNEQAVMGFFDKINRNQMWGTVMRFPIQRQLHLTDDVSTDANLYDPVFFLLALLHIASLGVVVSPRKWVETHAAALAVSALSSEVPDIRRIGYALLDQIYLMLEVSARTCHVDHPLTSIMYSKMILKNVIKHYKL